MKCSKCGHDQKDSNVECVRCGVVFTKFKTHQEVKAKEPAVKEIKSKKLEIKKATTEAAAKQSGEGSLGFRRGNKGKKVILVTLIVAFAGAGYFYALPYLTIHQIKIGFPMLRQNLKEQFNALIMKKAATEMKDGPFGAQGLNPPPKEPAQYVTQPSYMGDCRNRPLGTVCAKFSDGYVWLVPEGIRSWRTKADEHGSTVQVAIGQRAEYYHVLGTSLVKTISNEDAKNPSQPTKIASTSSEVVELWIKAVKPIELKDAANIAPDVVNFFKGMSPYLSEESQQMIAALLEAFKEAQVHDAEAKKKFGESLTKEKNYIPATAAIGFMALLGTPIMRIPPGSKAQVVKKVDQSPTEVVFHIRWSKTKGDEVVSVEETLVVVKEGDGWKVLLPGFMDVEFGGRQSNKIQESFTKRAERAWNTEKVREHSKGTTKKIQVLKSKIEKITQRLKEGEFLNVKAYVDAVELAGIKK